ncbi:hypothetical protein [Halorussus ruber]|uniref:hypothetical protein n=1 Tax=Halorussus ruber TaxID=1126238 RepID=UPI0010919D2A|nr:hypothetical protein [Halorussus ruber]
MGNTVRKFSSLGAREPCNNEKEEQQKLGDSLDSIETEEGLGDRLTGMFEEVDVDSVEAVRELREDT